MKILEAIYADTLGGSETLSLSLARAFTARGHECEVLTTFHGDGSFLTELRNSAFPVHVGGYHGRSIAKRISLPLQLYNLFRRNKYDVIHCHHMPVLIHCLRPARLAGIQRVVLTEHAHQHYSENKKFLRRSRVFGPKADVTTVIHEELRDFFRDEIGVPEQKLRIIENSVNTDRFRPGEANDEITKFLAARNWSTVFGCVSRLHPDKDIPNLIRAFHRLVSSGQSGAGLIIVGDGPDRRQVEGLVSEFGISENVVLCGVQSDIADWLRVFDVFVLPSRREGLPLAILEAMSSGLPIVATHVGGIPKVVGPDVGRLVPPENPDALADAMSELLSDIHLRSEMSINGRRTVERLYSFDAMVEQYLSAFSGG